MSEETNAVGHLAAAGMFSPQWHENNLREVEAIKSRGLKMAAAQGAPLDAKFPPVDLGSTYTIYHRGVATKESNPCSGASNYYTCFFEDPATGECASASISRGFTFIPKRFFDGVFQGRELRLAQECGLLKVYPPGVSVPPSDVTVDALREITEGALAAATDDNMNAGLGRMLRYLAAMHTTDEKAAKTLAKKAKAIESYEEP